MITKEDKEKIKKVFGGRYSSEIKKLLDKKGLKNRDGNFHTANMIRHVMNGISHPVIEKAIFDLYEQKIKVINYRKELLHKK